MENRFDMDNFEQTLKQHADQFSMIPTKRVWNGVYNSLHPGSKWPSLTMLLFFLLTLVGIGPLNQSSKNYTFTPLPDNSENSITDESEAKIFSMNSYLKTESKRSEENTTGKVFSLNINSNQGDVDTDQRNINTDQNSTFQNKSTNSIAPSSSEDNQMNKSVREDADLQKKSASLKDVVQDKESGLNNPDALIVNILDYKKGLTHSISPGGIVSTDKVADKKYSIILNDHLIIDDSRNLVSFLKSNPGNSVFIEIEDLNIEDSEKEDTELPAIKKPAKHNSKTTWIFYATPAISTTYFTGKNLEGPLINASPLIVNPNQIGNTMRFNARVGLNVGAEINYEFADNWEIITGTQLSYSGYNILSHKVHPTFSYLYLRDEGNSMEPKKYMTYYGSGEGLDEAVLHNTSFQLSIPIGIKRSVWKNNNVEIKIGTSLQPSLVLNGHAHILSSDGRNYVTDPGLMRTVNLSGELNSSISFQGDKVQWHVGPTVRYQALSSYKNIYPVNEHLIDYGIRIGISK